MEDKLINPYPGLRSFEETEGKFFFGRKQQIDNLLQKLLSVRFLMVIGASDSGKSSLVKAGLFPALRNQSSGEWHICVFKPGNDPISTLAEALSTQLLFKAHAQEGRSEILTTLLKSESGLIEVYRQAIPDASRKLLLVIDDFEELFRFSGDREIAGLFINLLLRATESLEVPITVLVTMRSDFLGHCTEFNGLPEAINNGQYLVSRMSAAEQGEAIRGPISTLGIKLSLDLASQLASDNPDELALLQHVLMRTWTCWQNDVSADKGEISIYAYEHAGTIHNALSQHLEEVYGTLINAGDQEICRKIWCTLVHSSGPLKGARRPRLLAEICELANATEQEIVKVIDVLRKPENNFLIPISSVPLSSASVIDVAHESILRNWERLITWMEEEEAAAQTYLRLCEAANLYESGKGGLLRDPELQVAWKWKEEQQPSAIWAARYNNLFDKAMLFLEYSKTQFEKELVFKEKVQKQRLKRARRISLIISIIALGAFLLAIYSFELKNLAKKQTLIAEKESVEAKRQRKLAQVQEQLAQKSKKSALESARLALEQKNIAQTEQQKASKSEKNALLQKVIAEQQKAYADRQKTIAENNATMAKQQQSIAETQTNRAVSNEKIAVEQKQISSRLKDLAEARNLSYEAMLLLNDKKFVESKKKVIDAYRLNSANNGPFQNSDIYTAAQFNWTNAIQNVNQFVYHKYPVRAITRGNATNQLLTVDESGMVYLSKTVNGVLEPITYIDIKDEARSISTSPDGSKAVVVTATGNAILLGLGVRQAIKELGRIAFAGIGRQVLFKSNTEFAILSNKGIGTFLISPGLQQTKFVTGNFSTMNYGNHKLYVATGNKLTIYSNMDEFPKNVSGGFTLPSRITSIGVDGAGHYLALGTYEGGIWIKDLRNSEAASSFTPHASAINDLKFSTVAGNVLQLASASSDQTIKLFDVNALLNAKNTEDILTLRMHSKWAYCLWYSQDGKFIYSGSEDKRMISWHTTMAGIYQFLTDEKN